MKQFFIGLFLLNFLITTYAQNNPVPLSNQDFNSFLRDVKATTFERDRLSLAEQTINQNYLLADQLRQVLEQFNSNSDKERLTKMAYAKIYDQSNFYQVYAAFDFEDSKSKIRAWVSEQPRNELNTALRPIPMSVTNFERAYRLLDEADFDAEQLQLAKELSDNNFLYASQVRDIVLLLDFKTSEDEFAKYAYAKTYDQQNYFVVLNALTFSSSKQSLSNWLKGQPVIDYDNYGYANNSTTRTWTSPYDDGDNVNTAIRYSGSDLGRKTRFDTDPPNYNQTPPAPIVVSDADFINIRTQLNQIPADKDRLIRAKQISDQSSWTAEQVRELMDMMVFENMRLDFAMYAYDRTMDAQNYYLVHDALSDANNQQRLVNYIQSVGGTLRNPSSVTNNAPNTTYTTTNRPLSNDTQTLPNTSKFSNVLSPTDFQATKDAITRFSSDNDRLREAKTVVDEQFLLSNQVGELVQLFVFDDVRLEFAKYAYAKTQDKENYDELLPLMQNVSSQEALRQYISEN